MGVTSIRDHNDALHGGEVDDGEDGCDDETVYTSL